MLTLDMTIPLLKVDRFTLRFDEGSEDAYEMLRSQNLDWTIERVEDGTFILSRDPTALAQLRADARTSAVGPAPEAEP